MKAAAFLKPLEMLVHGDVESSSIKGSLLMVHSPQKVTTALKIPVAPSTTFQHLSFKVALDPNQQMLVQPLRVHLRTCKKI